MKEEFESIPITKENMLEIAGAVRGNPRSPLVVPLSYERVSVPGALPECIDGVLHDPDTVYLDGMNVPVGPSHFLADERGHIYDAISMGITVQSLLSAVRDTTSSIWTLQLNLADPTMPHKLREFHRATPGIGLVALVTPQVVSEYLRGFQEFNPVMYFPNRS